MKIDLNKGISFHIEGELGKFNTLPIDSLIKIAESLQNLLITIAKSDINSKDPLYLDDFRIELSGFKQGSAVPQFVFTPRIQTSIANVEKQRKVVNQKFERLMSISNKADYLKISEFYPDTVRRNDIVDSLSLFTNSFGSAPVSIVNIDKNKKINEIFKIKKLKPEIKKLLVTKVIDLGQDQKEEFAVAKIKMLTNNKGKVKRKIEHIYKKSDTTLAYSPEVIVHNGTVYNLQFPLRSSLEKENDYFVIHNEMLGIIGTGETEDEAEISFAEEFDFIFKRYNQLEENQLSEKIQKIKVLLNYLVKSVD